MAAGFRSIAGPLAGRIAAEPRVKISGFRSIFGFWLGGLCAFSYVYPEPIPPVIIPQATYQSYGGGGERIDQAQVNLKQRLMREDDEMLEVIIAFTLLN